MSGSSIDRNVSCQTLSAHHVSAQTIDADVPHFEMYMHENTVNTVISNSDDFFPVLGAFVNSVSHPTFQFEPFSAPSTPAKVTYIGTRRILVQVTASISLYFVGGNNIFAHLGVMKNSTTQAIDSSHIRRKYATGVDTGCPSIQCFMTLDQGDSFYIGINNESGTEDACIEHINVNPFALPVVPPSTIP